MLTRLAEKNSTEIDQISVLCEIDINPKALTTLIPITHRYNLLSIPKSTGSLPNRYMFAIINFFSH